MSSILQIDYSSNGGHMSLYLTSDSPRPYVPEHQGRTPMVATRREEQVSINIRKGGEAADGGLMSFELTHLLSSFNSVDINGLILGSSCYKLIYEVDA